MKKLLMSLFAVMLLLGAAACGTAEEDSANEDSGSVNTQSSDEAAEETATETEGEGTEEEPVSEENGAAEEEQDGINGEGAAALPEEKEIEVKGEAPETKTAKLQQSDLGYYMYVLDGYSLEAEEPNKDVLLSQKDDSFFVRIEPVPAEANMDDVKTNAKMGLEAVGEVQEYSAADIHDEYFKDAEYYMVAEDADVNVTALAKEIDGQMFKFTMFTPKKETAEAITPGFWAMMQNIVVPEVK